MHCLVLFFLTLISISYFVLGRPMMVSNCLSEIGGTLFSLNTPDRFVLITLKAGILGELDKHKISSIAL